MQDRKKNPPNPTGKGGFQDHPELRSPGKPKNVQRFGYWLQFFKNMTAYELEHYINKKHLQRDMYVAELIAYKRVTKSLSDLNEYKDLADRTEGKAPISIDHTSAGEKVNFTLNWDGVSKEEE